MLFRKKERDKNHFKQLQMTSTVPAMTEISVSLSTRPTHTPRVPSATEGHADDTLSCRRRVSGWLK